MRPFAGSFIWKWIDAVGEWTSINPKYIVPLLSIQWGWGSIESPNFSKIRIGIFNSYHKESLYYNGIVFFRVMFPFYIGIMLRWSSSLKPSYFQTHIGWKLNGRLAIAFRFQTDKSAAEGMDFPNPGQAIGWSDGGK